MTQRAKEIIKYNVFGICLIGFLLMYLLGDYSFASLGAGWVHAGAVFGLIGLMIILMSIADGSTMGKSDIIPFLKNAFFYYHVWGTIQQGIFFAIYFLFKPWAGHYAIFIASFLFGFVFHFPNRVLTFATFGMGLYYIWSFDYAGYNNILIPFVGHGFLATLLMYNVPPVITTKWSVWAGYWNEQKRLTIYFKDGGVK